MVEAPEAIPALTCITAVADRIVARIKDQPIEDRRYGTGESREPVLRTLTIARGREHVVVLNGNASTSLYDLVDVRLSSPINRIYALWRVPVTERAPAAIVDAVVAFCAFTSPDRPKEEVEAGLDAAATILDQLGAIRLGA